MISSDAIHEELAALAWSLWSELGISAWGRAHARWFVDPEPLVLFTEWLGDTDARLRDGAEEWRTSFGSWLSTTRLRNLGVSSGRTQAPDVHVVHDVRRSARQGFQTSRDAHRARLDSFQAASLLSLRLRAILGVGVRAEIARILLTPSLSRASVSAIAEDAAFTKRNVRIALDAWRLAGTVKQSRAQNVVRYELAQPVMWRQLTAQQPDVWPRWTHLLPLLANVCDAVVRSADLSTRVRRVEGRKILDGLDESTTAAGVRPPSALGADDDPIEALGQWLLTTAHALAKADTSVLEGH